MPDPLTPAKPVVSATSTAAAAHISSPNLLTRDTIAPRLRPGYGTPLLSCATAHVTSLNVAGGNGPMAIRSAGFASTCARGLERAKMIGRSRCTAVPLTMSSLRVPGLSRRQSGLPAPHVAPPRPSSRRFHSRRVSRLCFRCPAAVTPSGSRAAGHPCRS